MNKSPLTQSGSVSYNRKPLYLSLLVSFRNSLTPQEVMHLINGLNLGVEAIIVGFTPKPNQSDTANPPYLVGLKNPIYDYKNICNLLRRELSQHISKAPEFNKRRGWNALCAMYPDRNCHIILWGISTKEFMARQLAATKKIGLYFAKAILSREGHQGTISMYSSENHINAISTDGSADGSASSNEPISTRSKPEDKKPKNENPSHSHSEKTILKKPRIRVKTLKGGNPPQT